MFFKGLNILTERKNIYDLQSLGEDEGSRESFNPLFGQVFHFFSNFHLWKCFDHNNNFLSPIMPYISYMCFGREREMLT